ncbi:MAG: transglycosylase SLT domain-containing protein [Burkholderiaceae bacterium]|nr:transglycosylase SLT domain-containing protein [Burkholderiaceae bacterium]
MLQQRQVGALFAVFVRTIGAVRFVRAVAPMAALVAVASIPLPRPAASIDVSTPPSGFVRTLAVAQRAVNGSADAVASNERRQAMRGELRVRADVADSGASPVSRIGDRWLQLRAGQRAMQRSVDESPRHVGDRLLHPAAAPAPGDWFAASTFEAFALLGDAVKTVGSGPVGPRAPPDTAQARDVDDPPAAAANEAAPAAQPQPTSPIAIERNALAAAPRSAASLAPASMARAAAEARADARDTFSPLKLSPEQRNISRFVARRYRLNLDDVQRFVAHAFRAAGEFRLDPYLVLAVMSIESNFNPNARSSAGAQGLMQVLTRVHLDKFAPFGGARAALDPVANITVGSRILKEYLVREGSVEGALKSYVGAALLPHDFGYGNKVLTERARIAAAAREGATPPSTTASVAATQIAMAEPQLRAATAIAGDGPGASASRQAYSALRAPALSEAKAREEL